MIKNFLILAGFLMCAGVVWAQEGRFVRKQLKPDFFMPEGELDYTEKLPPIPYNYDTDTKVLKAEVLEVIREADYYEDEAMDLENEGETPITEVEISTIGISFGNGFGQTPQYKQKFDEYMKDLEYIGQTGRAPSNEGLLRDLGKMGSNERVLVDEEFGL